MRTKLLNAALTCAAIAVLNGAACQADVAEQARQVAEANKDAVVTVQLVIETNMSYSGESHKEERKLSAPATVIDPAGLVVASLTEIDPSKMYNEFLPDESEGESFSSKVVDVKIKMGDGAEIPANVVLRDRDLDLAFLRPKKAPEAPMKFVDLTQAASPLLMDELVILSRLGQVGNRSLSARVDRVKSIITKPRTFYVVDGERLGCPVFALDGKPVGMLVVRTSKGDSLGSSPRMGEDVLLVAIPCSTMQKAAEQAKNAKPEVIAPAPAAKSADAKPADTKPATKPANKPAAKPK